MTRSSFNEAVVCPWCKKPFDVDPTSSASGFDCPACGINSSLGSLRNPDHRPNALQIAEHDGIAATAHLHRHTAGYVYFNDAGEEKIGSGTFVQLGDRLFLATVAHTKPNGLQSIHFVKKSPLAVPVPDECVIRRLTNDDSRIDVAVFELAANTAARVGQEAIGIERIYDGVTGNPNTKGRLIGYPGKYVVQCTSVANVRRFHALGYGCEPIEPNRWGAISRVAGTFSEDVHVVVEFNRDVVSYGDPLPVPDGLPDPFGMSGGGMWQRPERTSDNAIWTPSELCLFAIQSSWLNKLDYLKAIQIIHWLKLVADEYPDLRGELQSRFKRLKQMP